ncbi:NADH:ubiquinone oxidoreductase intermediate-associated protein 30 [Xylaria nigripes]|nr:NADH:ubiquinone oxidoreductase intermediate-associated protein 30 [Xylaria nigripes]
MKVTANSSLPNTMPPSAHHRYLFGGDKPWRAESWEASDDRVRGGKSRSYLSNAPTPSNPSVKFHGTLDITTLGGAGFASQRTPDDERWDLSGYIGLHVSIASGDGKKYTLILKDEVLPRRPDGRDQSTVSWEFDFAGEEAGLDVRWKDFVPTYRGRPVRDGKPLDISRIRRISIMMRSFFGEQEGPFALQLRFIAAAE